MLKKKINLLIVGTLFVAGCKTVAPIQKAEPIKTVNGVTIVDAGVTAGKIKIIQTKKTADIRDYNYRWLLTENGEIIQKGTLPTPTLNNLGEVIVDIDYDFVAVKQSAIYYLTVEAVKDDKVSVRNQFLVDFKVSEKQFADLDKDPLSIEEDEKSLEIEGDDFEVEFSKKTGGLVALEYDGDRVLKWGPNLKRKTPEAGNTMKLTQFSWKRISDRQMVVTSECRVEGILTQKTVWTIYNSGVINYKTEVTANDEKTLSEFVLSAKVASNLDEISYFGRKTENSPIVINSVKRNEMTIENQREETSWVKIQDGNEGFKLVTKNPLKIYFTKRPTIKRDVEVYRMNIDRKAHGNKKALEFSLQPVN